MSKRRPDSRGLDKIKRTCSALALTLCLAVTASAQTTSPAPEYENLFKRTSGWTGADGTYSYPLPDGRTLWGFSDTFFGEVIDGARKEPFRFVNNSLVVEEGGKIEFLPAPVFTPPGKKSWFWLFDGTDSGELLLGEFDGHGDGGFGFRQVGLWHARYRVDSDKARVLELSKLPHFVSEKGRLITFGPAILQTKAWLYLYGVADRDGGRHSVLARAPRESLSQPGTWRFFDGSAWSKEISKVETLFTGAAMEASVHQTQDGGYLYVGSDAGGMGTDIVARYAKSPEGPWGEPVPVGKAPEHGGDIFAYNAKAHPELTREGRLLVSYNVNTSDLAKVVADADIYRPRFFWWTPPNEGWLPAR